VVSTFWALCGLGEFVSLGGLVTLYCIPRSVVVYSSAAMAGEGVWISVRANADGAMMLVKSVRRPCGFDTTGADVDVISVVIRLDGMEDREFVT